MDKKKTRTISREGLYELYIVYGQGFKHKARGPELAQQKLQSGPLDFFGKCEGSHIFLDF